MAWQATLINDPPVTPAGHILEAIESIPVNIGVLADRLGLRLYQKPMDDDVSGYICRGEDGRFNIFVNERHSVNRQRFTAAHEIGHYVLHRRLLEGGTNDTRAYRTTDSVKNYNPRITKKHESEANAFAAALLMPEKKVIELYRLSAANDLAGLATHFGVSEAAMGYRINALRRQGKI